VRDRGEKAKRFWAAPNHGRLKVPDQTREPRWGFDSKNKKRREKREKRVRKNGGTEMKVGRMQKSPRSEKKDLPPKKKIDLP